MHGTEAAEALGHEAVNYQPHTTTREFTAGGGPEAGTRNGLTMGRMQGVSLLASTV